MTKKSQPKCTSCYGKKYYTQLTSVGVEKHECPRCKGLGLEPIHMPSMVLIGKPREIHDKSCCMIRPLNKEDCVCACHENKYSKVGWLPPGATKKTIEAVEKRKEEKTDLDMRNTRICENGHKMIGIGFDDECPECEGKWVKQKEKTEEGKMRCEKEGHAWADEGNCQSCGEKRPQEEKTEWEYYRLPQGADKVIGKRRFPDGIEIEILAEPFNLVQLLQKEREKAIRECVEVVRRVERMCEHIRSRKESFQEINQKLQDLLGKKI